MPLDALVMSPIALLNPDTLCKVLMLSGNVRQNGSWLVVNGSQCDAIVVFVRQVLPLSTVCRAFRDALILCINPDRLKEYRARTQLYRATGAQRARRLVERSMMICFMPSLSVLLSNSTQAEYNEREWHYLVLYFPLGLIKHLTKHSCLHPNLSQTLHLQRMVHAFVGEPLTRALERALTHTAHNRAGQLKLIGWAATNRVFDCSMQLRLLASTIRHGALHDAVLEKVNVIPGTVPSSPKKKNTRRLPLSFGASPIIRSSPTPDAPSSSYEMSHMQLG